MLGENMQLILIGIQFLIIFVLLPDLFFIHKDISAFKKIKEQYTDKIEYRKYLKSVILRNTVFLLFVISISVLLSFVSAFLYWKEVDSNLHKILETELSLGSLFVCILFGYVSFPLALLSFLITKTKKIKITFSIVFPVILLSGFSCFLLFIFGNNLKYYKNPFVDTKVSRTFNPHNLPLLKEGLLEDEVVELLGDPIDKKDNCFIYAENGKDAGTYEYLFLEVNFRNGVVKKINKRWMCED